ncbi:MAG: GNAT family N-acetyltransferase [Candidatus Poseidoniales archaeon]|jgi:predicted GNAT family N-acyltransferase|nr:GNAT family N-acetyltransferase [Candidatus Poseidoniales archaeon]
MVHRLVWSDSVDEDHLELRFRVLRIGMPRGSEHYPVVDKDVRTRYLCAYIGEEMVGCATLQVDSRKGCKYRIRGMAVDSRCRNQGIGSDIVKALQSETKKENTGIWCNARIRAVPMYARCGFKIVSDVFDIENIGPHYDMEWKAD